MEIREIDDKSIWENFLMKSEEKTFLSSWNWGEFNKLMGNKIWRLGVCDNQEIVAVALAVKIQAKRGIFLQVQHCLGISKILVNKLKEIAKEEGCIFIRVAPLLARGSRENKKLFHVLGFRDSPMHANAY